MEQPDAHPETVLKGIGVSPGVVHGPVFLHVDAATRVVERIIPDKDVDHELVRFEDALIRTREDLRKIQSGLDRDRATGGSGILDAHLLVLDDRMFIEDVFSQIRRKHLNVEAAVKNSIDKFAMLMASLEDDYLRERGADLHDVGKRILRNLVGESTNLLAELPGKSVVVASDLAPSETANMDRDLVLGFAVDAGSPTSHTAVLARALEIPAVVALRDVSGRVKSGDAVLLDGNKGIFIVNPTPERLSEYSRVARMRETIVQGFTALRDEPAETRDGHRIQLLCNIENPDEAEAVRTHGAQGVGLFRTEYLFMSQNRFVGEAEQAEAYTRVAAALAPLPVIIRTLDVGGDKFLSASELAHEANPFLGCRSIRLSLRHPDMFKTQLRAILRASAAGRNVKIMYPMISRAEEVIQSNRYLAEAKAELRAQNVAFDEEIEVGAMVEIPSAALTAEIIARHVRFFSIGTNDLIQYTIAVDRVNEHVAYLYEPTHPAVLRLIRMTIEAGHRAGIPIGVCGEMAADPLLCALLVGMGVDSLSVAPVAVPMVKDAIRSIRHSETVQLAEAAARTQSGSEVRDLCGKLISTWAPEIMELV